MKIAKATTEGTKSGITKIVEKVVMQTALVVTKGENKTVTAQALFYAGII